MVHAPPTARDIAALNKAATTIQKQIDGAEAGRLVGQKISLARTGYSHEQVCRSLLPPGRELAPRLPTVLERK